MMPAPVTDDTLQAEIDRAYCQMMAATNDFAMEYWCERLKAYAAMAKRRATEEHGAAA